MHQTTDISLHQTQVRVNVSTVYLCGEKVTENEIFNRGRLNKTGHPDTFPPHATVCSSNMKVQHATSPPLQGTQLYPSFSRGRHMYELQEASHRLGGAKSSHTHRMCEDFNNEPLTPNHRERSGVNKGLYICKSRPGPDLYKGWPLTGAAITHFLWHLVDLQVPEQHCEHGQILFCGLAGPEPSQHCTDRGARSWHGYCAILQTSYSLHGAAASSDFWQELPAAKT